MTGTAAAAVATDHGLNAATAEHWQDLAGRLKAVADPTRLCLLAVLRARPDQQACVKELTQTTGLAQPLVSHHLQILRRALLVHSTRHAATSTTSSTTAPYRPSPRNSRERRTPDRDKPAPAASP